MAKALSFEEVVNRLHHFWQSYGCTMATPYDIEMGAGTFHPATTLLTLGERPWKIAHIQPSRRPTDGRGGLSPNRGSRFHQYQVILKPSPDNIMDLYMQSLDALGITTKEYDIRCIEDDWESPTLGASGLGWEIACNGLEISQFTYMQRMGGIDCAVVSGELAYGIERLCFLLQNKPMMELDWNNPEASHPVTYGDFFLQAEEQLTQYYHQAMNPARYFTFFEMHEAEAKELLAARLPIPAYESCIRTSHVFNMLDARGTISVTERAHYIARIRELAKQCCHMWLEMNEAPQAQIDSTEGGANE